MTCGVRRAVDGREAHLFLGEPGELGLVANHYGSVALYRRSLLENAEGAPDTDGDTDWVLLASLSRSGARIVSVPRLLAGRARAPGSAATEPIGSGSALAVVHAFERATPAELLGLPLLTAALSARPPVPPPSSLSLAERIGWI